MLLGSTKGAMGMHARIVLLFITLMTFSGCRHVQNADTLIDCSQRIKQLAIVDDRRITLSRFLELSVSKDISGLVFQRDYAAVTFSVRATKYSLIKEYGEEELHPPQVLFEDQKVVYIKTSMLVNILTRHVHCVPNDYGRDEPYCPKRFFITYYADGKDPVMKNCVIRSTVSFEDIWNKIVETSVPKPPEN